MKFIALLILLNDTNKMVFNQLFNKPSSIFLLFCCLIHVELNAQTGNKLRYHEIYQIKASQTLVVLDDSATQYNQIMKAVIDEHWTISPVIYITESELKPYLGEQGYTMILKNGAKRIERRAAGSSEIQFNEIAIYPCNRGYTLSNYHARDAYAKIRVSKVAQPDSYLYKLDALILAMHRYLTFLDQGTIDKNAFEKQLQQWMNKDTDSLAHMTLLVAEEEMPERLSDSTSWSRYYDYQVRVLPRNEILNLLQDPPTAKAVLHLHPHLAEIKVISSEGIILYSAPTIEYKELTISDIINLSRAVSGKKPHKGLLKLLHGR